METVVLAALLAAVAVLVWPRPVDAIAGHDAMVRVLGLSTAGTHAAPETPSGRLVVSADEVAGSMVLLAVALRSGCGVVEAIEEVAAVSSGPAAHDLATVAAAHRWGVDDHVAWAAVDPAWARTGDALRLASRAGVAPSALLLDGAADLRAAELAALDVAAARVSVRMVLPLGLTFLPAFCLTSVAPLVIALAAQVLSP